MSRRRIPREVSEFVAERADFCCEYCFSQEGYCPDSLNVEHIIPVVRGGSDAVSNLGYSCQGCNNRKHVAVSAVDRMTGKRVRLFHPRKDDWDTHFVWSEDKTRVIGMTPIGRATVERLELNRRGVINLRFALIQIGKHPPQ